MLVVLVVNIFISVVCWIIAARLLGCRSQIMRVNAVLEKSIIHCEQLQLVPLVMAEQQLQVLQLRQIYQNQTGQIDRLWELLQLLRWLAR
jgi:hypothetical protein